MALCIRALYYSAKTLSACQKTLFFSLQDYLPVETAALLSLCETNLVHVVVLRQSTERSDHFEDVAKLFYRSNLGEFARFFNELLYELDLIFRIVSDTLLIRNPLRIEKLWNSVAN